MPTRSSGPRSSLRRRTARSARNRSPRTTPRPAATSSRSVTAAPSPTASARTADGVTTGGAPRARDRRRTACEIGRTHPGVGKKLGRTPPRLTRAQGTHARSGWSVFFARFACLKPFPCAGIMRHPGFMTNKAEPNAVISTFEASAGSALDDWRAIDLAISTHADSTNRLRLRRRAASDSLLALLGSWESFTTSWFTAAINREPSRALAKTAERITTHATEELRVPPALLSQTMLATSHFNLATIRKLLDKNGYNITIRRHSELKEFGEKWLADPYRAAVAGITSYQFMPAVVGRLVRNALAHASDASLSEVNSVVRGNNVPPAFRITRARNLDVSGCRAYVMQPAPSTPARRLRIEHFHIELQQLANRFRVP